MFSTYKLNKINSIPQILISIFFGSARDFALPERQHMLSVCIIYITALSFNFGIVPQQLE